MWNEPLSLSTTTYGAALLFTGALAHAERSNIATSDRIYGTCTKKAA